MAGEREHRLPLPAAAANGGFTPAAGDQGAQPALPGQSTATSWARRACAVFAVCALAATPATRAQAAPLEITGFTMQTTQVSTSEPLGYEPSPFTLAGGHPFALTSTMQFSAEEVGSEHQLEPTQDPREVVIDLPAGLLANPRAVPECPPRLQHCPTDTQVGVFVLHVTYDEKNAVLFGPIVNMTPYGGQAAELGLESPLGRFLMTGQVVRTAQGYTLAISARGLPLLGIVSLQTTLWGTPATAAHDFQRGKTCVAIADSTELTCSEEEGGGASGVEAVPFLTMPTSCPQTPESATAWADSWEEPQHYESKSAYLPAMSGCEQLPFATEIEVKPDTELAEAPVALSVHLQVHQNESVTAIAPPPIRSASVTLPAGVSINPGIAAAIQACPSGPGGIAIPTGTSAGGEPLTPGELGEGEQPGPDGEPQLAPGHCPSASVVGEVEAVTPLLANPIEGRVYLARPSCGGAGQSPCSERDAADGNLYRVYIELGGSADHHAEGVIVKTEAQIEASPATGQLTLLVPELPQLPLGELTIRLFGGTDALLTNPATCGSATTTSALEPWSVPYTADTAPSSRYQVSGCAEPQPLAPTIVAGSVDASAGAFSPFVVQVARGEREQYLSAMQLRAPPGLAAMLASVTPCASAQAQTGECPGASQIGESTVAAGSGWVPLDLKGSVYLTEGYEGAPFGLSIVTDAVAGPLNLGRLVVRARVDIDPRTAALTITTGRLPQILLGVPLRVQSVTLDLNRPGLILNPTDCEVQNVTATVEGARGTSTSVADRYALAGCGSLAFKPSLEAFTGADASFARGASLDLTLTFPKASPGSYANLSQIALALPAQLPSRLTALQSACPAHTFEADPAACPSRSIVGIARASTPILAGALTGPVIWVSHGHEAFPSPAVVLQGRGVTIELEGTTTIEQDGRVRVAFDSIPDVPLQSLQVYLPAGPHSILTAATNLCGLSRTVYVKRTVTQRIDGRLVHRKIAERAHTQPELSMPTELAAHNGAVVHSDTQVRVEGCR